MRLVAEDPTATIPGRDAYAATERVAKPLTTSDGQVFDLQPVQKTRLKKAQRLSHMTKRPKAKRDGIGRFLPNGRKAKTGLNRAILASTWGDVVSFMRYKALRQGKWVITVPLQHSSQECAVCTVTSPDNRQSQSEFVCQHCGHTDNAGHNAAVVIAKRGITKLLFGIPLTKKHKPTRIFRKLGPERSEVTPGANGPGAEINELGTSGSDPGNPRLNP